MAIMRLLLVVFVLAGCRQASDNTQNTPKKDEAVKQNNKTETVSVDAPPPQSTETVAAQPLPGPPVEVVDVPVPVPVLPGYAGFPRTFGSGGPGRKLQPCKGPECPGFIFVNEDCPAFIEVDESCPAFITVANL